MSEEKWVGRPAMALLAEKEEDRFTALLAELLRAPDLLRAFLSVCGLADVAVDLKRASVAAQVTVPHGRPDLVIDAPGLRLVFEAKVGAWLHDGQLRPYSDALLTWRADKPGAVARLYLIVPEASRTPIAQAAAAQLAPGFPGDHFGILSWQKIAAAFSSQLETSRDDNLRGGIRLFADLVDLRLGASLEPFSAEEERFLADPVTARAILRVQTLCERVIDRVRRRAGTSVKITGASGPRWQGSTLRSGGRWWWLGVWPAIWAQTGVSPIVLQVLGIRMEDVGTLPPGLPKPVPYKGTDHHGFATPLPLAPGEDMDAAADRLAAIVLAYVLELPSSGGPDSGATAPSA